MNITFFIHVCACITKDKDTFIIDEKKKKEKFLIKVKWGFDSLDLFKKNYNLLNFLLNNEGNKYIYIFLSLCLLYCRSY